MTSNCAVDTPSARPVKFAGIKHDIVSLLEITASPLAKVEPAAGSRAVWDDAVIASRFSRLGGVVRASIVDLTMVADYFIKPDAKKLRFIVSEV